MAVKAELTGDEGGELRGASEFLPFPKAETPTVEVVALDAEPTVAAARPTLAETYAPALAATARAAYATASSLVDAVASDTPEPPPYAEETPPPSPVAAAAPRKPPPIDAARAPADAGSPEAFRVGGRVANSPEASPRAPTLAPSWKASPPRRSPPAADSPQARHRTMWKPRSPVVVVPDEAFRPSGCVQNSPPSSPVAKSAPADAARLSRGAVEDELRLARAYSAGGDPPGSQAPVPLSSFAALGPARLPFAVRDERSAAAWDAAAAPAPEPNPRASRESLRASRDRDAELQTLRRRADAAEREAAALRDQARRDRQLRNDAEAEARALGDELGRTKALVQQLRDDAVEAATGRGRDAVAVEALQGRVATLEAAARDADDRAAAATGALERAGLAAREARHAGAAADARAAEAEAEAAEARAAVDGWRQAHADLRAAHGALGEEARRRAAEVARLRSQRAPAARDADLRDARTEIARLRVSADLEPPPPPPAARPALAPASNPPAPGPTPLAAFAPSKHAAGYRPPAAGAEPAAPRLAGVPTPFSPRDSAPFATARDEAHAARKAPLERMLLEIYVQRDLLDAELRKAPPHARSYAERRRRTLREERGRDLAAAAARVKAALRDLN